MRYKISPKIWIGEKPRLFVTGLDKAMAYALREAELGMMDYELFDDSGSLVATFHGVDTRTARQREEAGKALTKANDMGREAGFKGTTL